MADRIVYANVESPDGEEESDALETAYIVVTDCREFNGGTLHTARTANAISGKGSEAGGQDGQKKEKKVQFNPSSLSFSFTGHEVMRKKTDISKKDKKILGQADAEESPDILSMSVRLIFARDSGVAGDVERFLAMVKNPYTRQIAFYWGNTGYQGVLRHVDAEYMYFDSSGTPTQATVNLTINLK